MPTLSLPHSYLRYPLTAMLGSVGNVRILRALALSGQSPLSTLQLSDAAGLTPQGTRLVLNALARQRSVTVYGSGRSRLYALNPSHPMASAVVALFQEEQRSWIALLESIREVLNRHGTAVGAAWLYGSVARGEDAPDSDLDIAIVVRSQAIADQVREDLASLEDEQQLRVSLTALTPKEFAALPEDDPWWSDVVRDGRVLKGPAPDQAHRRLVKAAA